MEFWQPSATRLTNESPSDTPVYGCSRHLPYYLAVRFWTHAAGKKGRQQQALAPHGARAALLRTTFLLRPEVNTTGRARKRSCNFLSDRLLFVFHETRVSNKLYRLCSNQAIGDAITSCCRWREKNGELPTSFRTTFHRPS